MKTCCQDEKNLIVKDSGNPDIITKVCSVCGCRHLELLAAPIRVGIQLRG